MTFNFFFVVSLRLRSVKNIQKITKSMKMVSAAKFGRAERELRPARVYGAGASGQLVFYQTFLVSVGLVHQGLDFTTNSCSCRVRHLLS